MGIFNFEMLFLAVMGDFVPQILAEIGIFDDHSS